MYLLFEQKKHQIVTKLPYKNNTKMVVFEKILFFFEKIVGLYVVINNLN